MNYIEKSDEPLALKNYKRNGGTEFEELDRNTKSIIQNQLIEEQKGLCAYCMSRIKKEEGRTPKINIEHIEDQSSHPELQLSYTENMVGVCLGGSDKENATIHLHCDKSKDRESIHRSLRKLNPLNQNVERLIKFTRNGELVSNDADEDVEYDIETLNLNEYFLKKSRCDIIDELQERYSIQAKRGKKREFLKQEMKRWSSCNRDGNLPEFNLVALKFIDKKIKKLNS